MLFIFQRYSYTALISQPHLIPEMRRRTRRKICIGSSKLCILLRPESQLKQAAVKEEAVSHPCLVIRLAIQLCALDVNVAVSGIKVDVANGRRLGGSRVSEVDLWEEWWDDEVDVLSAHGVQAQHGKGREAAHGTRVIVSWKTGGGVVEGAGDVSVQVFCGETWSSGVVEYIDKEIGLFITNVKQAWSVVHKLKTTHKSVWTTECCD